MTNPTESTGAKPVDPSTEFPEFTKDIERAVEKELVRRILEPILKSAVEKELSRYAAAPAKPTLRPAMQPPQAEQTFGARCAGCSEKDRELAQRSLELDKWRKEHVRREQEIESLKRTRVFGASKIPVREIKVAPQDVPAQRVGPDRTPFRAGDFVKHGPTAEEWVLACDEFSGCVMPAGWPESTANASDCELVKPATDEERVAMLGSVARSEGTRAARAKEQLEASAPEQPAPEPARRRRFRAGDRVRLPAQTTVYSAVLDENDAGSVAIEVSRNELNCISTSALTLIEPTHRARRNRELAFHFHRWSISTDTDAMDSVPEFVRVAAEQLLHDPFGTEYGSVLADASADAKTGGAK